MQKQKINSVYYLVLQSTYENIEIALFNKEQILSKKIINKIYASRELILNIDFLLKENKLSLQDLAFSSVNQGPAPFTTLRVVITTVNALNFTRNLPIIGIDGLNALLKSPKVGYPITVALLNAFNNDVYFAIEYNSFIKKGWENIKIFLNELKNLFPEKEIVFIGNAINIYKDQIKEQFSLARFLEPNLNISDIEQIGKMAYQNWLTNSNISQEISPLYLKDSFRFKKQEYA